MCVRGSMTARHTVMKSALSIHLALVYAAVPCQLFLTPSVWPRVDALPASPRLVTVMHPSAPTVNSDLVAGCNTRHTSQINLQSPGANLAGLPLRCNSAGYCCMGVWWCCAVLLCLRSCD